MHAPALATPTTERYVAAGPWRPWVRRVVRTLPRGRGRCARLLARLWRTPFVDAVEPHQLNLRLVVDPSDPFQLDAWLGAYQPHVVSFLRHCVRPDSSVLVAGTHTGYTAAIAARLCGSKGWVLTADPDPNAIRTARRNLSLLDTDCGRVDVLEAGLSNDNAQLQLYESATLGQSSFSAPHHMREVRNVSVRRGDDWLKSLGVEALDVLLLDVEGWECQALDGLSTVISHSPRLRALIEVSPWALENAGASVAQLFAWLRDHGFSIRWALQEAGPYGVWGDVATADRMLAGDVICVRGKSAPT